MNINTINPKVKEAEYAVRGQIVIRAGELQTALNNPEQKESLPFDKLYFCNIGNPQSLGQTPITFFRQVLAACFYPALLDSDILPKDARERARAILGPGNTMGAYTHSQGYPSIRKSVAKFIEARDGHPADPDQIFLTDGASPGVKATLQMAISGPNDGILIPVPQYPLYSASIALLGGQSIGYYLNEDKDWGVATADLQTALDGAKAKGITAKALAVINPGNPTGQCLSRECIEDLIKFAHENDLVLLADEVYQTNIYDSAQPFYSFKKVLCESKDHSNLELVSFHSVSKGVLGECGTRGGFMELHNFDKQVRDEFYKLASVNLCPNIAGQVMVDLMTNPPKEGDESYPQYKKEWANQLESLKRRAKSVSEGLSSIDGISCAPISGAMYAFPQITVSKGAIAAAKEQGVTPDAMYCMELLETTGVCVVPGSGFLQREGTFHFRTTILPPEDQMNAVTDKFRQFHAAFTKKYS